MAGQGGEELSKLMALGVLDLTAEEGGGHLVRLVADDEVPATVRDRELGLNLVVAGEFVETGDREIVF